MTLLQSCFHSLLFSSGRRTRAGVSLLTVLGLGLFAGASSSHAAVVTVGGAKYGLMSQTLPSSGPAALVSGGGPVVHRTDVFAIYWDPGTPNNLYPTDYPQPTKLTIDEFLSNLAQDSHQQSNVLAVDQQYADGSGRAGSDPADPYGYSAEFTGAYSDQSTAYPTSGCTDPVTPSNVCLTDSQLQSELAAVISAHQLPTGLNYVYLVMTPPSVTTCTDAAATHCSDTTTSSGYCAYHSYYGTVANPVLYADIPFENSTNCQPSGFSIQMPNLGDWPSIGSDPFGDELTNTISHELDGVITDPELNGYQDSSALEAPDKCQGVFSPILGGFPIDFNLYDEVVDGGHYFIQGQFNNAQRDCLTAVQLSPEFVAPNQVNVGDLVGFDPSSTFAALGVAQYTWSFGDGQSYTLPCTGTCVDPSVIHAYTAPGTYPVQLTVTDGGGYTASTVQTVIVNGTSPSSTTSGGGSGSGGSGSGGSGSSSAPAPASTPAPSSPPATGGATTTGSGAHSSTVRPQLTAHVASRSLSTAVKSGVTVTYTVNEQVAGHFELLIDQATARKLKITGAKVTAKVSGAESHLVLIGEALLVTTKAGHSQTKIVLTKSAASRLRHVKSLKVTLRMTASDANGHQSTLTSAVLLGA